MIPSALLPYVRDCQVVGWALESGARELFNVVAFDLELQIGEGDAGLSVVELDQCNFKQDRPLPCQVHTASTMPCTRARSLLCRVRPYPRRAGPVTSVYRLQVFVPVLADLPATLMVRARARNAMGESEWVSSQPLALVGPPSAPAGVTIQQEAALSAAGTIATIFKALHPLPLFTGWMP